MSPFWCLEFGDGSKFKKKKIAEPSIQLRVNPNAELRVAGFLFVVLYILNTKR